MIKLELIDIIQQIATDLRRTLDQPGRAQYKESMPDTAIADRILYEDNHLIAVNKLPGELAQGDQTGDPPLSELVKEFIRRRDNKPGEVFLGIPHRIDRPTSGVLLLAKTSKALARMNTLFRDGGVEKRYWALIDRVPELPEGEMRDWLRKDQQKNKSFVTKPDAPGAKEARLRYRLLCSGDRYHLVEVIIETGRHHQIRCQLAARGIHVKGDLKYGARRSNPDGGISLHARLLAFEHPIGTDKGRVVCIAPPPEENIWRALCAGLQDDEGDEMGA